MADDLILQDADRTKLDGIVQKMTANNENDADIQFVVNDFKQKYGVKKKEVSKPTAQVSSNGTTKTSQSSYNLDLSLPKVNPNPNNSALPGLGKPFKPEIALKSINDERKFINAKTPTQTNFQDYNTVINDGIKGQNKFDNTTQILTSQNVIPQQAKKEVQQLQQKQQVVKDAKKDTRQNILAVIPELADAKNTDEAITTILKSDMKNNLDYWQQFDDEALLGNDENTLNDFLVSNGLKNQDRELYLKEQASSNPKYGYEYEYNKIGSLFKAVKQRADDYDTVLKQKFGDNYMEVAKQGNYDILNDQDFNKFRQLREKQNELSTKANGLINDSRYSEVKSSREKVEKAQQGVDERAKNDKAYKIGDELNYIGNKLAYGAGHVVKMIAELPSLATSLDKGYDWTDKVADWGNRFSDNLIESIPVSTDKKTGVFNKVADVDGYKVFVDESGEPIDVRDKNNFKVPLSVSQSVVEKFSSNPQSYKTRNEMNSGALVDNGLNTMIDMGIMILGTKGAGMVGAGEKLQKLTSMGIAYQQTKRDVFNDAIKKGLDPRNADLLSNIIGVAAGTSSMLNPMEFNIAKGAGLFNLLKTDGLNAAKLALIKDGKLSVKDYAKEFVSGAIKNTIGENIEELGIENTTQAIANNHFNNQISETDMVDGGLDDRLHILDKQGLETFLITAGSSFLMTPIEINSQTQFNQQEAMKMAIENPEDFAKIKELQLKQGQISQQQFDNETKIYNDVSKTYNAVKDDVKEELQPQLLALLTKKSNLSNKISEIKDEVLSKPYKEQLEQINKGIESISNGKNASESLVAPIEKSETLDEPTETIEELQKNKDLDNKEIDDKILSIDKSQLQFIQDQQKEKLEKQREEQNDYYDSRIKELSSNKLGQSTAKDGSSTISKTETAIANKINKGQELTSEETDYYNAKKDSIDKLVTVNKSTIQPINEVTEVKKEIVLPPPTPQVVAPAELDEQQITEQLNEVLNDKTTPTPLVDTEQEQNISERLPSEYQNNQGVQQIDGIGQDVSNESEVAKVEENVVDGAGGDVEIKNKALEELVNLIPTPELRRANGSIGTQGFTEENLISVARHIADDMNFEIPAFDKTKGTSEVRQVIDYLKSNKDAQHKIKQYVIKNPAIVSLLPDNTYQIEDGNHRANLLNLIGVDVIPTIELNGRNKENVINEHNKVVEKIEGREIKTTPRNINEVIPPPEIDNKTLTTKAEPQEVPKVVTQEVVAEIKSKNLTHVKGKNMGENQALGTYISTEKGNRYETPTQKAESVEVDIKNPLVVENDLGLVGKRTEILNDNKDQFTKEDTVDYQELPDGKITLDDLNDAGIKKLAKLTTEKLQADGYDGIYFKESKTQEGELVVFDKNNVKFKSESSTVNESSKLKADEKQDLVKSLNKEQVKEFVKLKTPQEKESYLITIKNEKDGKADQKATVNAETESSVSNDNTTSESKKKIKRKGTPRDKRKIRNPEYLKALNHDVVSAEDYAMKAFIGGIKVSPMVIERMFTTPQRNAKAGKDLSGREKSARLQLIQKNGIKSLDALAHSMWENQEQEFGFEKFDTEEIRDAIESVLNSYTTPRQMVDDLNSRYKTDEEISQEEKDSYQNYVDAANDKELTDEDVDTSIDVFENLTDEQIEELFKNKDLAFIDDMIENSVPTKRTESEIKSDLKLKQAELKILEEKQTKLTKQLEQNLKENQLDLLQGAKPQAMFDDKVEQQKIAEKSKSVIENKRKEIAKLNEELDNINQGEIPFQSTDKKFTTISQSKFNQLLDKLKKAFPNVKVELFGKGNMESAKKALAKYGVDSDLQSIYNIIGLSVLATSSTSQINQQPLIANSVSGNLNLSDGNVVEINDNRLIDKASGNKITDKNKMSASVTEGDIKQLTLLSNKHGVDPYTMIAMTMQETNFDTGLENPFHYDPQNWEKYKGISENPMEIAVLVFKDKLKYAERLGKKTEAEKIQAYNGYGKIGKKTDAQKGSSVRSWYGISSSNFPIDMNKTPIYGNRVLDIRDNIIKSNPKIVKLVESQSNNIAFLKTKDGTIYGFKTPDGKVFINTDNLNANTPIHEYAHIWQSVFPNEFARGIELLKLSPQGQALIREIQKNPAYKGKTISEIQAEALVAAIGNKGETIFNSNPSLYNKFKQWLNDLFAKIGEKLGIKNLSPDDKFDMFTKKVVGELLGGKVLDSKVGTEKSTEKTITFQGQNIKVKEINGGAEVVNGFYSPLEKIINETKFEKLPAKQWVDKFAKGEEAKWTGLTDWLNQQQGSVSKADIQQYLKDNRIQVVEVVKDMSEQKMITSSEENYLTDTLMDDYDYLGMASVFDAKEAIVNNENWVEKYNITDKKLIKIGNKYRDSINAKKGGTPKFETYQLEGEKENYKEVLVTLPSKKVKVDGFEISETDTVIYEDRGMGKPLKVVKVIPKKFIEASDEASKYIRDNSYNHEYNLDYNDGESVIDALEKGGVKIDKTNFESSHFDEPNILVHLRMNTRVDAQGNKILFLEEVQSDWGQKGKKEGFEIKEEDRWNFEPIKRNGETVAWKIELKSDKNIGGIGNTKEDAIKDANKRYGTEINTLEKQQKGTPSAPFVTDTNAWTKLGLKVALKEAVKQGAEKIGWTTGEQQNERYDLSKQVQSISYEKKSKEFSSKAQEKGQDLYSLYIETKEIGYEQFDDLTISEVEGYVGKDIANKIQNNEGNKENLDTSKGNKKVNKLTGIDLKVGGKGMKGFYGSPTENSLGIVGNVAKSLFKQEPKTVSLDREMKFSEKASFQISKNENHPLAWGLFDNNRKELGRFKTHEEAYQAKIKAIDDNLKSSSTQHSIDITPEMKAMVELGQPLFQFKPDELTNKVQELRDFELNDEEIRDYLLEAGNTKQQIDDALGVKEVEENKDETKKELSDSKQRVAERIVLGNSTLNAVKEHIVQQGYDKSDYDSKQIFKDVDELINKFGIEKAESFIDKIGDVGLSEPHKVVLQHKIAEYYGNKALSDETLTEEERKDAMFKSAQLFLDLSEQRTDAGRGNAILAQIYLDSDIYFTLPMFENKMNAIGAQLSGAEKIELENLQNEIKELRKENTKLQELAKKEAEQQIVDDITTHLLVDDLIIDSKIKDDLEVKNAKSILAKGFEDIARMLSSIAMAQQVDKVKFKDTILDMTKATMTISKIGVKKALKSVIKAIKNANQNIDEKLLEDAEKHVLSQIKDTDTGIKKKNKEGISKDELIELIEQGADTMEKMVEAIRNKYYDGDKSISDKQIRDEITNYGNSIRQSQTQVEEKLSEIKSLMLLQSKLEDAENNVAPKKTGFIRDKDKIAVREKRRELAEAMKKLTVTLSEDDIAGLNERKLTQISNKIEEVQKVFDGYEKIKNKANFDYNDAVKKKQQELDDLMSSQKALLHYAKENLTNLVAKYQDKLDKKQYSKNPTLNKLSITDSEYQKLKNQLEAKKEQLKSERDNFRNNNADYLLENRQKQIDRQIAEIDKLLAGIKVRKTSEQIKAERDRKAGVINSSTNQTALDKLKENQKILEAKKEQWERKVIQKEVEIEKAKQTWLQKIGINLTSVSRTLTLGLTDIGWLGVQGGYFGRTKPHLFAKALGESLKGKLSEEAFNQWKRDLKSNPFYETMIKAGLRIPSQSLRDDIFEQEFRESGFTKLLGKNEVTDIVNKNARLSVKFLANLRIQVFQKMYNGLTDSQKADKEVLEKLADYVNSRSGAGQVIGEDGKRGLNKWWGLLTSARNTSAMLQQTYIGMLYGLTKNYDRNKPLNNQPMIARQIVGDVLNQAVLFSGLYLSYMVASGLSGDDDEWNVETSPFSTNFLKLKNKEGDRSYFDMGGMTALNVATLRLLTTITNAFGTDFDNFKDYKGEYSKVGLKDFSSKTGLQILSESIFNRTLSLLAPIKNPFTAKSDKDGNYSMYGKTYTPTEFKLKMLMDMFIPMNLPNIYNDITDKDVNALNAIVNTVLNVIGISNQNQKYDKPEDSTSPQVNSVPVKSTPVSSMPIVPRPVK